MPCVLRQRTSAALDHLRGAEKAFSLCRNLRSLSDAEITLRDLVETTQDVDRVQHLWKEAGQKVREWLVVAGVTRCQERGCIPAARGDTAAVAREEKHRQPPNKLPTRLLGVHVAWMDCLEEY